MNRKNSAATLPSEHSEQACLIKWADLQPLPDGGRVGEHLFAIPNGGERNAIVAARLKAEGVRPGVPDLFLALPRKDWAGLFVEMKRSRRQGRVSAQQREWLARLRSAGYAAEVCFGAAEAIATITAYLKGVLVESYIKPSEACKQLIREFEGLNTQAYRCPAGVLTIGYGHTGSDVEEGMVITKEQAENLLTRDLKKTASQMADYLKNIDLNQNQIDALISFVYNVGIGRFATSTLLLKLKAGDYEAAADQLLRWTKSGGKELKGLVLRRQAERRLFLAEAL